MKSMFNLSDHLKVSDEFLLTKVENEYVENDDWIERTFPKEVVDYKTVKVWHVKYFDPLYQPSDKSHKQDQWFSLPVTFYLVRKLDSQYTMLLFRDNVFKRKSPGDIVTSWTQFPTLGDISRAAKVVLDDLNKSDPRFRFCALDPSETPLYNDSVLSLDLDTTEVPMCPVVRGG